MIPEDLLFWISALGDAPTSDPSVLCRRHADAMVVPRGWTLDDRREEIPRLFMPRPAAPAPAKRPRPKPATSGTRPLPEQLRIDGTGEIARPPVEAEHDRAPSGDVATGTDTDGTGANGSSDPAPTWEPAFDPDDDLDGLLEASSPLLARAFRGAGRAKS